MLAFMSMAHWTACAMDGGEVAGKLWQSCIGLKDEFALACWLSFNSRNEVMMALDAMALLRSRQVFSPGLGNGPSTFHPLN
jgi:hypothetical protein